MAPPRPRRHLRLVSSPARSNVLVAEIAVRRQGRQQRDRQHRSAARAGALRLYPRATSGQIAPLDPSRARTRLPAR